MRPAPHPLAKKLSEADDKVREAAARETAAALASENNGVLSLEAQMKAAAARHAAAEAMRAAQEQHRKAHAELAEFNRQQREAAKGRPDR